MGGMGKTATRPVSAPPGGRTSGARGASTPDADRTPSSSSVTVSNGRERAARRAAFDAAEAEERASYEAAAAELARQKIARARLQRDADALVRQERRVAEKQRRADGVARRKESNAKAEFADREAVRARVQMRLDAARKKKRRNRRGARVGARHARRGAGGTARGRGVATREGEGGGRGVARVHRARETRQDSRNLRKVAPEVAPRERSRRRGTGARRGGVPRQNREPSRAHRGGCGRRHGPRVRRGGEGGGGGAKAGGVGGADDVRDSRSVSDEPRGRRPSRVVAGGSQEGFCCVPGWEYARPGRVRRDSRGRTRPRRAVLVRTGVGDWRLDQKS
mmetsp:Transcript_13649/g.53832  ORF Transcript_13649/g.53832 Transcript_13649/m.53832 type:complete len:336 (-) Transcript_13649:2233-3240(-)